MIKQQNGREEPKFVRLDRCDKVVNVKDNVNPNWIEERDIFKTL